MKIKTRKPPKIVYFRYYFGYAALLGVVMALIGAGKSFIDDKTSLPYLLLIIVWAGALSLYIYQNMKEAKKEIEDSVHDIIWD